MIWFKRRWTIQRLAAHLQARLPDEYLVLTDDIGLAIKDNNVQTIVAAVDLSPNSKAAVIAFSVDVYPGRAAELALILSNLIDTYVDVDMAFYAETLPKLRADNIEVH